MFRFRRPIVVMLGMVGAGLSVAAMAQSTDRPLGARVERLLEKGWPRTVDARVEAQRRYDRLAPLAAAEPRIPYAYALIEVRQYRYAEAISLLDQVIRADPGNLSARELRIWLGILLKDYGRAMVEMPQLAERLPAEKAGPDAQAQALDLAGQLGRMCGFLEGPVEGHVDQTARAACVERLFSQLGEARRTAFETGRKAVLRQFVALGEETEMTATAAKETGEKTRRHVLSDLDRQADDLAARTDAEKTRVEDLQKTLNSDLEKIRSGERQLAQDLGTVGSQAVAARQDLGAIDAQIGQFLALAGREQDPNQRQWYLGQVAAWQIQRNARAAALMDLDRRAAALVSEQQSLGRQRRDLDRRWKQETGRLEKLEASLHSVQGGKEKLQSHPVDANTPQVADQKRRIVALTAYVPLPISLDEEKARLVASFVTDPPKAENTAKP
ncbi:MAG: hypothetical protein ABR915_20225 [Thermoguttaceae bacterium]|jgi:predicted  nucleic acid-binding Zn-ribbon protein